MNNTSYFCHKHGYGMNQGWKKLYDRIPSHENTHSHKENYILWKNSQRAVFNSFFIDNLLEKNIIEEEKFWVTIF